MPLTWVNSETETQVLVSSETEQRH